MQDKKRNEVLYREVNHELSFRGIQFQGGNEVGTLRTASQCSDGRVGGKGAAGPQKGR